MIPGPLYFLTAGLMFGAVTVGTYTLLATRGRLRPLRVTAVSARGPVDLSRIPSTWFRLSYPILNRLAPFVRDIRWLTYRQKAAAALQRSGLGDTITVDHLIVMKALVAVVAPVLLSRMSEIASNPAVFLLIGVGGFYLPDRMINDLRRARERHILRSLPGSVDVLSLSVEAGLEFLMAIQRLVERGAIGPLRDELATILNDIRLGMSRADALKGFSTRVGITEVSSFVSVLVQADMLGASIGTVLKSQAERMRVERFQRAEKAGARATQKILLPLVLFIFPAVLVVIIGPVALQFIYAK